MLYVILILQREMLCRKAVKATSVLFPLLGTINLLFVFQPRDDSTSELAYRVANAVLQSSQVIS